MPVTRAKTGILGTIQHKTEFGLFKLKMLQRMMKKRERGGIYDLRFAIYETGEARPTLKVPNSKDQAPEKLH